MSCVDLLNLTKVTNVTSKPTHPPMDIGESRALSGAGTSRRKVYLAFGSFFLLAALLNGRHLHDAALKREYGFWRDVWVMGTRPLSDISVFLRLDRFRDTVETLREAVEP
jgi:hypothetical protein